MNYNTGYVAMESFQELQ